MFAKSVVVLSLLVATASAALKIDTPSELVECQDVKINFDGGNPKYLLAAVPGQDPCGNAYHEFDETSDGGQTWKVNLKAGTSVMFVVEDSSAAEAWSGAVSPDQWQLNTSVVVKEGSDKSCLPAAPAAPPAAPSGSPAPAGSAPPPSPPKPTTKPPTTPDNAGLANIADDKSAAFAAYDISSSYLFGFLGAIALLL